jgi:hypothetical protein
MRCTYCGGHDRTYADSSTLARSCSPYCERQNQRWDDEIEQGRRDAVHGLVFPFTSPKSTREVAA